MAVFVALVDASEAWRRPSALPHNAICAAVFVAPRNVFDVRVCYQRKRSTGKRRNTAVARVARRCCDIILDNKTRPPIFKESRQPATVPGGVDGLLATPRRAAALESLASTTNNDGGVLGLFAAFRLIDAAMPATDQRRKLVLLAA